MVDVGSFAQWMRCRMICTLVVRGQRARDMHAFHSSSEDEAGRIVWVSEQRRRRRTTRKPAGLGVDSHKGAYHCGSLYRHHALTHFVQSRPISPTPSLLSPVLHRPLSKCPSPSTPVPSWGSTVRQSDHSLCPSPSNTDDFSPHRTRYPLARSPANRHSQDHSPSPSNALFRLPTTMRNRLRSRSRRPPPR